MNRVIAKSHAGFSQCYVNDFYTVALFRPTQLSARLATRNPPNTCPPIKKQHMKKKEKKKAIDSMSSSNTHSPPTAMNGILFESLSLLLPKYGTKKFYPTLNEIASTLQHYLSLVLSKDHYLRNISLHTMGINS